jgi:uracil-DNA glycosylase
MIHPENNLSNILQQIRACKVCADHLPLGPRPVIRASPSARLAIIGQAPGTRVHESGVPWDDRSGDRLRDWLSLDKPDFYDETSIAIVPMGFCYPGRDTNGGDSPPRPECAPLWHAPVLEHMPQIQLTLLVGSYAQKRYLGRQRKKTMTETVAAWRAYLPHYLPLPHPSWRNTGWLKRNTWFETELVPDLRREIKTLLA